jgi:hypothetical protein
MGSMARVIALTVSAQAPREIRVSDLVSAALHALVGPALLLGLNAGVVALGSDAPAARTGEALGLPGWLTVSALALALACWGLMRWMVAPRDTAGRNAADWLVVLMAATIAFPFITLGFDFVWTTIAAFVLFLVGLGSVVRVARVSPIGALVMAPTIVALGLPFLLGFTLVSAGWTPPFAVTNASEAPTSV